MLLRLMPSILLKKDVRKAKKALDFYDGVGGWRVETNKVEPILHKYSWRHNEIPKIPVYKSEREEVEDEWDTEAICKKKKSDERGCLSVLVSLVLENHI